jgi:hypothetical protein
MKIPDIELKNKSTESLGAYNEYITDIIHEILIVDSEYIQSIVLYGGICRDNKIINAWSDIDLFIFYNDIWRSNSLIIGNVIAKFEYVYKIRLDVTRVNIVDLNPNLLSEYNNSTVIGILSNRGSNYRILYGSLPVIEIGKDIDIKVAYRTTLNIEENFRNILIDHDFKSLSYNDKKKIIERVIRWINTYLRNALIICGQYTDPYEQLANIIENYYDLDVGLLYKMCYIRKNYEDYIPTSKLIDQVNQIFSIVKPQIKKKYETIK